MLRDGDRKRERDGTMSMISESNRFKSSVFKHSTSGRVLRDGDRKRERDETMSMTSESNQFKSVQINNER